MGNISSCCLLKCLSRCRKHSKFDGMQETASPPPPIKDYTRTNMSINDGIQTFQEYVDRAAQQREKDNRKEKTWLERITCWKSMGKQPPEPTFWIEPAPGYVERICPDFE